MATIGANALIQAVALIIFARSLGPAEYAVIVMATAVATVAAEFVGFGSGDLLVRDVSRDPATHSAAFGRALGQIGLTIIPLALMATYAALVSFHIKASFIVLFTLVVSEIAAIRFVFLAEQIAIAHHRIHLANASRLFATGIRIGAVLSAVYVAGVSTAAGWAIFAAVSSAVMAIGCLMISARSFGAPKFARGLGRESHVGVLFSLMQILRAAQLSLDKFAVAAVATPATVGAYGVASRASQLGTMPASAITRMTYPTFFAHGAGGLDPAIRYAVRIAPAVLGIGLLSSAALVCIAYALPLLLGPEFATAKTYLMLLALLPLASALQNLAGSVLSGADFQAHRIYAAVAGLVLTVLATLVGAHFFGVSGAILGYMAGHFLLAAATVLAVTYLRRRIQKGADEITT